MNQYEVSHNYDRPRQIWAATKRKAIAQFVADCRANGIKITAKDVSAELIKQYLPYSPRTKIKSHLPRKMPPKWNGWRESNRKIYAGIRNQCVAPAYNKPTTTMSKLTTKISKERIARESIGGDNYDNFSKAEIAQALYHFAELAGINHDNGNIQNAIREELHLAKTNLDRWAKQ